MMKINKPTLKTVAKEPLLKKKVAKNTNGTEQLILCLQCCITQVQTFHWNSKSYAEHMALGELYECLTAQIDILAEQYIPCYGPVGKDKNYKEYNTPMDLVKGLIDFVEATECEKRGINATIDNIHTVLLTALYKLNFK